MISAFCGSAAHEKKKKKKRNKTPTVRNMNILMPCIAMRMFLVYMLAEIV